LRFGKQVKEGARRPVLERARLLKVPRPFDREGERLVAFRHDRQPRCGLVRHIEGLLVTDANPEGLIKHPRHRVPEPCQGVPKGALLVRQLRLSGAPLAALEVPQPLAPHGDAAGSSLPLRPVEDHVEPAGERGPIGGFSGRDSPSGRRREDPVRAGLSAVHRFEFDAQPVLQHTQRLPSLSTRGGVPQADLEEVNQGSGGALGRCVRQGGHL